jgi:ribosomal protein L11 methyltransferase
MKQIRCQIPQTLASRFDDRLLEAGALAVDMAPPDEQAPQWVRVTIFLEPYAVEAVQACLRKLLRPLPRSEQQRLERESMLSEVDDTWQSRWAEGLEPVHLVPGLVLVPEGANYEARVGERLMLLEKSLVFGFGEHPTTRMIAAWLANRARDKSVLDVGAGSGVLAFVAAHHGAKSVLGLDIDPLSVEAATRNARRNGWHAVCQFEATPVEVLAERVDVVVANIDALTLERLAPAIASRLHAGGVIAVTGVLEEQCAAVCDAFVAYDVSLRVCERTEDGWVLLTNDR